MEFRARFKHADILDRWDRLAPIDLIPASPECTGHSLARGAKPPNPKSVRLLWRVWRFTRVFQPRFVVLENAPAMRARRSYLPFQQAMRRLGYQMRECVLDAANFGVPQTRKRLYLLFDRQQTPPDVPARTLTPTPIGSCLRLHEATSFRPLNTPGRAQKTLERVKRAVQALGGETPFLMVYYGSGPQWRTLHAPPAHDHDARPIRADAPGWKREL